METSAHFLSLHQWSVSLIDILAMELPTARINKAGQDVLEAWKATLEAAKSPLTWKLTSCAIFRVTEKMGGVEKWFQGLKGGWRGSRSRGQGLKINEGKETLVEEWKERGIVSWARSFERGQGAVCVFNRPSRSGRGALRINSDYYNFTFTNISFFQLSK